MSQPAIAPEVISLVTDLEAREVDLWVDGKQIRWRAPEGAFGEDLIDEVRRRKPDVLRFLRLRQDPPNICGQCRCTPTISVVMEPGLDGLPWRLCAACVVEG